MSISSAFEQSVKKYPEKVAIELEQQQFAYKELNDRSSRQANFFFSKGISNGDRIAFFSPTSIQLISGYLAFIKLGTIIVPVNHQFKEQELLHVLNDTQAKAIVTDEEHLPLINKVQPQLPELKEIILLNEEDLNAPEVPLRPTSDDDVAVIFYTSGTTGKPKGAALTHRNITCNLEALRKCWQCTENDVLVHALPLYHVHGFAVALLGSLLAGSKIILKKKFDAGEVLKTIEEKKVTLFMGVPTMYYKMLEVKQENDISSMRLFISGSAPLASDLFFRFKERFGFEILERAGMTETLMNFSNPIDGKRIAGSVGFPLAGVEARIVNQNFEDQPVNTEGEILLRGENVFRGYWRNEEATAQSFHKGWFMTGDIGKVDDQGYYYIVGRKKEVIKSGGVLIFPREIEEVIEQLPMVNECAVIGIPDKEFGEAIKACVVPKEKISAQQIIDHCKKNLASFKKPRQVEFMTSLPKNTMGKILKEELRKKHVANS